MIQCPDCGKSISSHAVACPECGRPMKSGAEHVKVDGTVTTQSTSKKIKAFGCLFAVMIPIGMIVAMAECTNADVVGQPSSHAISATILTVGICGVLATKIAKWWFHE